MGLDRNFCSGALQKEKKTVFLYDETNMDATRHIL